MSMELSMEWNNVLAGMALLMVATAGIAVRVPHNFQRLRALSTEQFRRQS